MDRLLQETSDSERYYKSSLKTVYPYSPPGNASASLLAEEPSMGPDRLGELQPGPQGFLKEILALGFLTRDSIPRFLEAQGDRLSQYTTAEMLGNAMTQAGLLTSYQVERLLAGTSYGLILGNYRVLKSLGAGGMGVLFVGQHYLMQRHVAIKVLRVDEDCPASLLKRFYEETRVLADMHHPNIVQAFDAGELAPPHPGMPALIYLVMELVSGGDLEKFVNEHGPQPIRRACQWIHQAACGLQEAHNLHLIHRDIKPSNLFLTTRGEVKLGDFGLARQFCSRLTDPRAMLGSVDFMAPEQSHDPTAVGTEADIYGLGATLFWLLTGEPPHLPQKNLAAALRELQQTPPRRLRMLLPNAPEELDLLLARMMDPNPGRRPALPLVVMNALVPILTANPSENIVREVKEDKARTSSSPKSLEPGPRILIVDDDLGTRQMSRAILEEHDYVCGEAGDGEMALTMVRQDAYDLVLLDLDLASKLDGFQVCRCLREQPPSPHFKIIIVSGRGDQNDLAETLPRGADDYIPKPFEPRQLIAKVRHVLSLKQTQERVDQLAHNLLATNRQLECSLQARATDVRQAQDALIFAMAKMAELPDEETPQHLRRLQLYTRRLGEWAAGESLWAGLVNEPFLECLERCVPLHDIGMIGLPAAVLLQPRPLSASERVLVETHTILGDRILEALAREHGNSLSFLRMARMIARHHHERHDGKGYPDGLAGSDIPLAARLVTIGDVYDRLRSRRVYKPPLAHGDALKIMTESSPGQFDPELLRGFKRCASEFDQIFHQVGDEKGASPLPEG